jgi:hypothetical protein
MHIDIKRKLIEEKMYALKVAKRERFREFLVSEFTDEDLKNISHSQADRLLVFLGGL